jgi:hypothetical protein
MSHDESFKHGTGLIHMETRAFKLNGLSTKEFISELDQTWADLAEKAKSDPSFAEELRMDGNSLEELTSGSRRDFVRVEQTRSGLGWEEWDCAE